MFTDANYKFDLFGADCIQEGTAVTIFCSGIMVQETMKANEILKQEGIDAEIINIHTIKPIDRDAVVASAKKTGAVVVAENHNVIGGFLSRRVVFYWGMISISKSLLHLLPVTKIQIGRAHV